MEDAIIVLANIQLYDWHIYIRFAQMFPELINAVVNQIIKNGQGGS